MNIQQRTQQPQRILFAQLTKVDEENRLVYGIAAQEVPDNADEMFDYAGSKPYFEEWSAQVHKDTAGKSMGNLRSMHGNIAAGKLTAMEFNDAEKSVEVACKVVDDNEWQKVLEGVYTGFSIGGKYIGDKKIVKVAGKKVSKYIAKPNEISLVDRPCIPTAKFFEVKKVDGSSSKIEFKHTEVEETTMKKITKNAPVIKADETEEEKKKRLEAEAEAEKAKKASGAAADEEEEEVDKSEGEEEEEESEEEGEEEETEKMLKYETSTGIPLPQLFKTGVTPVVGTNVELITKCDGEEESAVYTVNKYDAEAGIVTADLKKADEPEYQVEGSDEDVTEMAKLLNKNDMAVSDVNVLLKRYEAVLKYAVEPVACADVATASAEAIRKSFVTCGELGYLIDNLCNLQKRAEVQVANTKSATMLKGCIVKLASCLKSMINEELTAYKDAAEAPTGILAMSDSLDELCKLLPEEDMQKLDNEGSDLKKVEELAATVDTLQKRLKAIEDQPAHGKVVLKVVSKGDDVSELANKPVEVAPVVKGGVTDEAATLMKNIHATGGKPLV